MGEVKGQRGAAKEPEGAGVWGMKMYKEYNFNGGKFHVDCGTCFFKMNDKEAQRKGDYFKAFKTVKLNREFCETLTKNRLRDAVQ